MTKRTGRRFIITMATVAAALLLVPRSLLAHCDGLDGPVVKAAQRALETGDVRLVLVWVQPADEAEITTAFAQTRGVRTLNAKAQELADRYFFETLVRLHRAGEGEPYTGLKPAGRDLGPVIPAADQAVETASAGAVIRLLNTAVERAVSDALARTLAAKTRAQPGDVSAGRAYVAEYVPFVQLLERIYEATVVQPHGHSQQHAKPTGG